MNRTPRAEGLGRGQEVIYGFDDRHGGQRIPALPFLQEAPNLIGDAQFYLDFPENIVKNQLIVNIPSN